MENKFLKYALNVLDHKPESWLKLTTHRLDIYNEKFAKVEFLDEIQKLFQENNFQTKFLNDLPTAFDYIRLGHPLSCLLEWVIAESNHLNANEVISFSSQTMPLLAILRTNSINNIKTRIYYKHKLPIHFDINTLKDIYGYDFEHIQIDNEESIVEFEGSNILIDNNCDLLKLNFSTHLDFLIRTIDHAGSVILSLKEKHNSYISAIQHVRRRETIAMTPASCLSVIKSLTTNSSLKITPTSESKIKSIKSIQQVTGIQTPVLLSSSGLSIQYAILMGLTHDALEKYPDKKIKIIVPPNCYGGTNDQARRVAASLKNVEVVDLPVDAGSDMVKSVEQVLEQMASIDAIPYIIAEIPTNPRVEVPELIKLKEALCKKRTTSAGVQAIDAVFILDQTFCPNVHFLGDGEILSNVRTISYVSGSKFPSGGLCTAGYCVTNTKAENLIEKIELHLNICNNQATDEQLNILAKQLPSMNQRIDDAYKNTREFVDHIEQILPSAKINFVSKEIAAQSFTPSVFSIDLPTKGNDHLEKESFKRELNHKLIRLMIERIPEESKHCVSYGQLKGCYWTIPATSTQGTTKEGDKDYIIRVSVAPEMNVKLHKQVFSDFVRSLEL